MLESLKAELAALNRFLDILQQEQSALINIDVDTLLALSDKKLKLAGELNQLALQRVAQLKQAGFAGDSSGMKTWIASQQEVLRDSARKNWDDLLQATRTAQQVNETNGKLIVSLLQHNQQALNALASAANQASVYGPDGQPHAAIISSGRTLGKV